MTMRTPYELHWDSFVGYQEHFQHGDAVALVVFTQDAKKIDPGLSDTQVREALRLLSTDPKTLADLVGRHLRRAIAEVKQTSQDGGQ